MYTIPLLFDRSTLTLTAIQNENKVIFGVFVVLCIHFKKNKTSSIKLIQKVSSFRYAFVNFFHKFSPSTSYWIVLFFWFQLIRKLNTWNKWKRLEGKSTAHYFGLYAMTFFFIVSTWANRTLHHVLNLQLQFVRIAHLSLQRDSNSSKNTMAFFPVYARVSFFLSLLIQF